MVKGGYSVYYYGTATWAGNQSGAPSRLRAVHADEHATASVER